MINIVLSGGSGTRLWPISRELFPKQFYKFAGNKLSLFQETVIRNKLFSDRVMVIGNEKHKFLSQSQLEESKIKNVSFLLETVGRNTAPAIALAASLLNPEEIMIVTPSDHIIRNINNYNRVIKKGIEFAKENNLVTFGITPTYPEVGYGYIEADGNDVKSFHEKPVKEVAEQYIQKGNFYWNSGIFCFKAKVFLEELKKYSKNIYDVVLSITKELNKDFINLKISKEDMLNIPANSIDYAVMEKSDRVKVVFSDLGWSDLGSFDSLEQMFDKDENLNTLDENLIAINSKNNFLISNKRKIALVDINNLIIVDDKDALVISKKGKSQEIKEVVRVLKEEQSDLLKVHQTAFRPWGSYTVLEDSPSYKVKNIIVYPNSRLSLQKHKKRNENWTIVSGLGKMTLNDKEFLLKPSDTIFIPKESLHRIENIGNDNLIFIEVQTGEYFGEDDIIRIEDDYNRI